MNRTVLIVIIVLLLVCLGALCVIGVAGILFFSIQSSTVGEGPVFQETFVVETVPVATPVQVNPTPTVEEATETRQPTEEPTETQTQAAEATVTRTAEASASPPPDSLNQASSDQIEFFFRPDVAESAEEETVPGETDPDAPYFAIYPEHSCFMFAGYPTENDNYEPQLCIYPVEEYRSLNEAAAETIDALEELLADRPATPPDGELPFLPIVNAAQFFKSQVRYLDFASGSGVRFLTQYGQGYYPVNNRNLFYTFQGITADGELYITAIFPVSTPALPDPDTLELDDEFAENFPNYLEETAQMLAELPPTDFTPNLLWLDELIESIEIN